MKILIFYILIILLFPANIHAQASITVDYNENNFLRNDYRQSNEEVKEILQNAYEYLVLHKFNELALETYRHAYDLYSNEFGYIDYCLMGIAYQNTDDDQNAIKYIEMSRKIMESQGIFNWRIYYALANGYKKINNNSKTLLYCQKILMHKDVGKEPQYLSYQLMGEAHYSMERYEESIDDNCKCINIYSKMNKVKDPNFHSFKDEYLGLMCSRIAYSYMKMGIKVGLVGNFFTLAAKLGDSSGIKYCQQNDINWRDCVWTTIPDSDGIFQIKKEISMSAIVSY